MSSPARWLWVAIFGLVAVFGYRTLRHDEVAAPAKLPAVRAQPAVSLRAHTSKATVPYQEAKPLLARYANDLPLELAGRSEAEIADMWAQWLSRHDGVIRSRVLRGEEDSAVNFWLYGTSFTDAPRVTDGNIVRLSGPGNPNDLRTDILDARLGDLVDGVMQPGSNERLQFVRHVLEQRGVQLTAPTGREQARLQLIRWGMSSASEADNHQRKMEAAKQLPGEAEQLSIISTLYRDRGLAPDTSIHVGSSLEQSFKAQKEQGALAAGSVRRVAVIGPGLDFTDKLEGFDFYPQQSIQPFAVIDSLLRLGLASPDLRLTTFDINPRITFHLETARRRASAGEGYVLQVPLTRDRLGRARHPDVVKYWEVLGREIGDEVAPILPRGEAAEVRMRAVKARPTIVRSIDPLDLNIVVERLELPSNDRFDLVVATNVLVYYSGFEQSLVLTNLAKMVRPGGLVVTNYALPSSDVFGPPRTVLTIPWDRPPSQDGDTIYSYQRR